jgi:hypothetical protein
MQYIFIAGMEAFSNSLDREVGAAEKLPFQNFKILAGF